MKIMMKRVAMVTSNKNLFAKHTVGPKLDEACKKISFSTGYNLVSILGYFLSIFVSIFGIFSKTQIFVMFLSRLARKCLIVRS